MFDEQLTQTIARARQQSLGDLLHRTALRHPDRLALVFGERRDTFSELDAECNRVANALAGRGVSQGERVAILSRNHRAFVVLYVALARIGVIAQPINFMLNADEVAYLLGHSEAMGLIVEDALVGVAEKALTGGSSGARDGSPDADGLEGQVRLRGVIGDAPEGWEAYDTWSGHDDPSTPDVHVPGSDPVHLMYTSGTESRPKGAMLSSDALIAQYYSCVVDGEMSADDVEIHALPLYHCAATHCFLFPDLLLGATSIVLPGAEPGLILETVQTEGVTKLFCPPTVWIALLRHPEFDAFDLSTLRKGYYGASIMPIEVLKELQQRLPDVRLFNFYGQTEMAPLATFLPPEEQVRKAGSAGRAALNVETRVVDDDGHEVRGRRDRRDRAPQPPRHPRLLPRPREDRRGLQGRVVPLRGPRHRRRGGLPHRRRPQEGHDQDRRGERRQP